MAELVLCSVFDSKVGSFGPLFCARAKGEAIRLFMQSVQDGSLPFGKFPGDFALFVVGEFNDYTGALTSSPTPVRIIGADEIS